MQHLAAVIAIPSKVYRTSCQYFQAACCLTDFKQGAVAGVQKLLQKIIFESRYVCQR